MNSFMRFIASVCLAMLSAVSGLAGAANYTLWVNGRGGGGEVGNYASFAYWGPASTAAGVNKKAVNWDGYNSIASQNGKIRDALDCFCTGTNWCYVATHSAGDLMMGYTMASFGGSTRQIKNAAPNSSGVCANTDGSTQTGWNIKWIRAASGAAGGSELADAGDWTTSSPLVSDLKTATARALYDHNNTRNVTFHMYAGARASAWSFLLPGDDDKAIAYHSSGAVAGSAGAAFCNPGSWYCNDLTLGSAPAEGDKPKWAFHSVAFRDDARDYDHFTNGNWQGIVGVVRDAVVSNAQ